MIFVANRLPRPIHLWKIHTPNLLNSRQEVFPSADLVIKCKQSYFQFIYFILQHQPIIVEDYRCIDPLIFQSSSQWFSKAFSSRGLDPHLGQPIHQLHRRRLAHCQMYTWHLHLLYRLFMDEGSFVTHSWIYIWISFRLSIGILMRYFANVLKPILSFTVEYILIR